MCSPYTYLYDYGLPKDIINVINIYAKRNNKFCFNIAIKCDTCLTSYCKHKLKNVKICSNKQCDEMCCPVCYKMCSCEQEYFCNNCNQMDCGYVCEFECDECVTCHIKLARYQNNIYKYCDVTFYCLYCMPNDCCYECGNKLRECSIQRCASNRCKRCNKDICDTCVSHYKNSLSDCCKYLNCNCDEYHDC